MNSRYSEICHKPLYFWAGMAFICPWSHKSGFPWSKRLDKAARFCINWLNWPTESRSCHPTSKKYRLQWWVGRIVPSSQFDIIPWNCQLVQFLTMKLSSCFNYWKNFQKFLLKMFSFH